MRGSGNLSTISRSLHEQQSKNPSTNSGKAEDTYVCKISLCVTNKKAIIEHLDLERFKTEKCTRETCRNVKTCPFYHSGGDCRRDPFKYPYSPEPCEFGRNCFSRMKCQFAHNKYEINYHPLRYKKKYCSHLLEINHCRYGKYCAYAHNDQDIRIELLHTLVRDDDFYIFKYKTEFCPFQMEHNIRKCIYGHSWEDYRRRILRYPYSKNLCKYHAMVPLGKLDLRCPDNVNCPFSHNHFEADFHPQNYKKFACPFQDCDGVGCPFLHREESQRFKVIDQKQEFYLYPYNRIVPSAFPDKKSFFNARSSNIW